MASTNDNSAQIQESCRKVAKEWNIQRHDWNSSKIQALASIIHFVSTNQLAEFAEICKLFNRIFKAFITVMQYDISFGMEHETPIKCILDEELQTILAPIPKQFNYITQNIYSIPAKAIYPSCDCTQCGIKSISLSNDSISSPKSVSNQSQCYCLSLFGCSYVNDAKSHRFLLQSIVNKAEKEAKNNTNIVVECNDNCVCYQSFLLHFRKKQYVAK